MNQGENCLAVIRVRGVSDVFREIKDTLTMFHLTRNCHATLIDDRPSYLGMLHKIHHYVTWGEISKESVTLLLKKRGRLLGDKKFTDDYARELGYASLDDLSEAICDLDAEYSRLPDVKPLFRLHPPKKGFKGKVKKSYTNGGVTGYRGTAINDLLKKMI